MKKETLFFIGGLLIVLIIAFYIIKSMYPKEWQKLFYGVVIVLLGGIALYYFSLPPISLPFEKEISK